MAVYTDITEIELGAFLANYEVGELLSYKGIAEGVENSNFLLHTSSGAYILTLYEKRVSEGDLPFFVALLNHLARRGSPVPAMIEDREGRTIQRVSGRAACIIQHRHFTVLSTSISSSPAPTPSRGDSTTDSTSVVAKRERSRMGGRRGRDGGALGHPAQFLRLQRQLGRCLGVATERPVQRLGSGSRRSGAQQHAVASDRDLGAQPGDQHALGLGPQIQLALLQAGPQVVFTLRPRVGPADRLDGGADDAADHGRVSFSLAARMSCRSAL